MHNRNAGRRGRGRLLKQNKSMTIISNILKENGIWSIKRIIALVTFVFMILLGVFIVVSDKFLLRVVNPYAIQVFNSLLGFLILLLGITEVGKKFVTKTGKALVWILDKLDNNHAFNSIDK